MNSWKEEGAVTEKEVLKQWIEESDNIVFFGGAGVFGDGLSLPYPSRGDSGGKAGWNHAFQWSRRPERECGNDS